MYGSEVVALVELALPTHHILNFDNESNKALRLCDLDLLEDIEKLRKFVPKDTKIKQSIGMIKQLFSDPYIPKIR